MKYHVTLNNKVYEVEVERGEAILVGVSDARPAAAALAAAAPVPAAVAPVPTTGEPIQSPLPGVVLALRVSPGDAVKAGQVVVVIEAMKMENEIVAPRDGRIAQIVVDKGSAVETGTTLLTLA